MDYCKVCGSEINSTAFQKRLLGDKGVFLCENCAEKIVVLNHSKNKDAYNERLKWLNELLASTSVSEETKEYLKSMTRERDFSEIRQTSNVSEYKSKKRWTSILKIVSYIILFLFMLGGCIAGVAIGQYSGDMIFFVLLGLVVGGVVGAALMVFVLFSVEVAENISEGVDLLNSINDKLSK